MFILYHADTKQVETFEPTDKGILVGCCKDDGPLSRETARQMWRDLVAQGWVRVDEKPKFDRTWTTFMTYYRGCGTIEALEQWRDGLYRDYHPCGYGTHLTIEEVAPGVGIAKGSRSNSCD